MFKKVASFTIGCSIVMGATTGAFANYNPTPYTGADHPCKSSFVDFQATITKEVADKGGVTTLVEPSLSSKPYEALPTKLFYGTHGFTGVVKGEMVNGSDKWYVVHNMWANTYVHSSNFEKNVKCLWN
ncbi:hypothetical protein J2Z48_000967 [Croceifilum oryzae]|uniref:Uncharacterized protein n=1 Tax=Croceifilum oryzae TaxID=1553429 RepID=A0AAJ1WRP2_9BACL|nr:hypothetical protein [Croceifilum oryzae]MDQ0416800.1 hypothetical protein [Croceifilum oryzae]